MNQNTDKIPPETTPYEMEHDRRLRAAFRELVTELSEKGKELLLLDAEELTIMADRFLSSAYRTREQKAEALTDPDFELEPTPPCSYDFNIDRHDLRDALDSVTKGDHNRTGNTVDPRITWMNRKRLVKLLDARLNVEFEGSVTRRYMEMETTQLFESAAAHITLKGLRDGILEWIRNPDTPREGLEALASLEDPYAAVFAIYMNDDASIEDFIYEDYACGFKDFFIYPEDGGQPAQIIGGISP